MLALSVDELDTLIEIANEYYEQEKREIEQAQRQGRSGRGMKARRSR